MKVEHKLHTASPLRELEIGDVFIRASLKDSAYVLIQFNKGWRSSDSYYSKTSAEVVQLSTGKELELTGGEIVTLLDKNSKEALLAIPYLA